jgi:hypothetical protein
MKKKINIIKYLVKCSADLYLETATLKLSTTKVLSNNLKL